TTGLSPEANLLLDDNNNSYLAITHSSSGPHQALINTVPLEQINAPFFESIFKLDGDGKYEWHHIYERNLIDGIAHWGGFRFHRLSDGVLLLHGNLFKNQLQNQGEFGINYGIASHEFAITKIDQDKNIQWSVVRSVLQPNPPSYWYSLPPSYD